MNPQSLLARLMRTAAVLSLVLAGLAGCDSSSRIEPYVPTRMMSFGDDLSAVDGSGLKVNINGASCGDNPLWNQRLASEMGLTLPNCPLGGTSNGVMGAVAGARVADIAAQVAAARVSPGAAAFVPSTLVTVQGGLWDVIDAYDVYKATASGSQPAALVTLEAQLADKGRQLAGLINDLTNNGAGPRVIYGTVPDLGCSPRAYADGIRISGSCQDQSSRSDALTELTKAFNTAFRTAVINDGRYAGEVIFDDRLRSMTTTTPNALFSSLYLLFSDAESSLKTSACNTATPSTSCTTTTLVANATSTNWLWAFDVIPGPAFHNQIAAGTAGAIFRARNNPF
ncbi:SGNH/GDSL hydrolase family protein [Leptothrix discophora]|uniref:Esterase n=1 Tax=Leptothrix discophora TaxID=89 RepID=A0ABT9G7Q7_LEPDI|nr:SGNH/GDSL hydrolase family protein [Leptothrix discophora]MDP4302312.1 hypothetical protein [Leptothrix discophora]